MQSTRLLKFNNETVDIDEKTAIGIDFQAYDIADPMNRKTNVSNSFSIPKTRSNMRLIGHAGSPQSVSKTVYSKIKCDYWAGNNDIIRDGIVSIQEVGDRIVCLASAKGSVFKDLEDMRWMQFQELFFDWLVSEKSLPNINSKFIGTFADFIRPYTTNVTGLVLPNLVSNFFNYGELEDVGTMYLNYDNGTVEGLGGHMSVYANTVFEFIEDYFNVDFNLSNTALSYNAFQDAVIEKTYLLIRNIQPKWDGGINFWFEFVDDIPFLPKENLFEDHGDKTLLDFTKSFFQHFNILIDSNITNTGNIEYYLRRFDDILNAGTVEFGGKLTGEPVFYPSIKKWKQNNYIVFSDVYDDSNSLVNAKYIQCKNQGIEVGEPSDSPFEIKGYIPEQLSGGTYVVPDMSQDSTFKEFTFFISDSGASNTIKIMKDGATESTALVIPIARLNSLASEYNVVSSMLEYPVRYSVNRWFNLIEVLDLQFFKLYNVPDLGGVFFLNKISGYNPSLSRQATSVELIKIK